MGFPKSSYQCRWHDAWNWNTILPFLYIIVLKIYVVMPNFVFSLGFTYHSKMSNNVLLNSLEGLSSSVPYEPLTSGAVEIIHSHWKGKKGLYTTKIDKDYTQNTFPQPNLTVAEPTQNHLSSRFVSNNTSIHLFKLSHWVIISIQAQSNLP